MIVTQAMKRTTKTEPAKYRSLLSGDGLPCFRRNHHRMPAMKSPTSATIKNGKYYTALRIHGDALLDEIRSKEPLNIVLPPKNRH